MTFNKASFAAFRLTAKGFIRAEEGSLKRQAATPKNIQRRGNVHSLFHVFRGYGGGLCGHFKKRFLGGIE